jgi:hypothetical protein
VIRLCWTNFAVFIVGTFILGGDAWNGHATNGHYFVADHGHLTEVTKAEFVYS